MHNKGVKLLLLCLCVPLFMSFTQEHLIYFKNLNKTNIVSLDQILQESGLMQGKSSGNITNNTESNSISQPIPVLKKTPEINKQLTIPQDQDFTISLAVSNNFIVLKSVQGDVQYQKDKSSPDNGMFQFHNGIKDSKITLQIFNPDGSLDRNLYYFVKAQQLSKPLPAQTNTNTVKQPQPAAAAEQTKSMPSNTSLSPIIISSVEGLSPPDAIRELNKMMGSGIQESDREMIRYKLAEILISQKSYSQAETNILQMTSEPKRAFYYGKFYYSKKNYKEAIRNYLNALKGDDTTKKSAILDMENAVLDSGSAEKGLLDTMESGTKALKSDKVFYGNSMINIARIYEFLPDAYQAQIIFESILSGDFDSAIKNRAKKYYDELKRDFLDYK